MQQRVACPSVLHAQYHPARPPVCPVCLSYVPCSLTVGARKARDHGRLVTVGTPRSCEDGPAGMTLPRKALLELRFEHRSMASSEPSGSTKSRQIQDPPPSSSEPSPVRWTV